MARTTMFMDVPPAAVWTVLADATTYDGWVVGCKKVRAVEGDWPAPRSAFHHAFGVGPAYVKDKTLVLECEPRRRLLLEARAFPLGAARVEFLLDRAASGTHVTLDEEVIRPLPLRAARALLAPSIVVRNTLTLHRLRGVARRSRHE